METLLNQDLLTREALANYNTIEQEMQRRSALGMLTEQTASPVKKIQNFLTAAERLEPTMCEVLDKKFTGNSWAKLPDIILAIPVVGTGSQEEETIRRTLTNLSPDATVASGNAGVLIVVNRPQNTEPDSTYCTAQKVAKELGINSVIVDIEVAASWGSTDGPFAEEMATDTNQAPIGLLRDMLNIGAMKLWLKDPKSPPPILLQMDGDFEGFAQGGLADVLARFADPSCGFIQCTSDWDSVEYPIANDPWLKLGADLMKELPQIIKTPLNDFSLNPTSRAQLILGQALQRGIQVPQAARMESIAGKGSYGLARLREDELDQNIRIAEWYTPGGVRSSSDIVFKWNNRRAVKSWRESQQPPISQWIYPFQVVDIARGGAQESSTRQLSRKDNLEYVVNRTLARFPVPRKLLGVYDNYEEPILAKLNELGLSYTSVTEVEQDGLYYVQLIFK